MRIAVNTGFLLSDYPEDYGYFIFETFKYLTNNFPEHQFIFISDRTHDERFIFSSNITPVVIGPLVRHPLLWKYWSDIKIPAALKKYKADVFVSFNALCSLTTRVSQCLVVTDLAFLHYAPYIRKSHLFFYKRFISKSLQKAKSIATVSEFLKQDIINQYKIEKDKINVVYSAAKEIFKPVPTDVGEATKNKYTAGIEYFLYTGGIHPGKNLVNLLKAFSVFKKRQKSNFKLVLAGKLALKYDSFIQNLKNYKYRDDVIMLECLNDDEFVKIMGSAYALVYPPLWDGLGVSVLEAMQCHVPVITSSHSSMQEIARDAALYVDAKRFEDIGEKMMLIYKSENLRKELIEKGKIIALQYSWKRTAELLWQTILKAVD
jgi:glycosyltransferase involved in cell wall biosynthesis